jgi:hypothetical protein
MSGWRHAGDMAMNEELLPTTNLDYLSCILPCFCVILSCVMRKLCPLPSFRTLEQQQGFQDEEDVFFG